MNTLLAASICSYEIQATICYTNQVLVIKTNYSRHLHLYISETSHPKQRKILATFKTLGTMSGNLLAYIMGAVFDDWRDSALVLSAIPFLASVTMLLFPETPYWLASVGRSKESRYTIDHLLGSHSSQSM